MAWNNVSVEIERHIFHIAFGTALAILYFYDIMRPVYFIILTVIAAFSFWLYKRIKIPGLHQFMIRLEREENLKKHPGIGALYYMLGSTIATLIYPKEIALASIMVLAWGDGVAGLMGSHKKKPTKEWKSTITAIITASITAQFFVPRTPAIISSVITMLLERFEFRKWKLDDNLVVPLTAGLIMILLQNSIIF